MVKFGIWIFSFLPEFGIFGKTWYTRDLEPFFINKRCICSDTNPCIDNITNCGSTKWKVYDMDGKMFLEVYTKRIFKNLKIVNNKK